MIILIYNFYREEKTEALLECKEELEHNKALLVKLRQEVIYILSNLLSYSEYIKFFILESRVDARSSYC